MGCVYILGDDISVSSFTTILLGETNTTRRVTISSIGEGINGFRVTTYINDDVVGVRVYEHIQTLVNELSDECGHLILSNPTIGVALVILAHARRTNTPTSVIYNSRKLDKMEVNIDLLSESLDMETVNVNEGHELVRSV